MAIETVKQEVLNLTGWNITDQAAAEILEFAQCNGLRSSLAEIVDDYFGW